MDLTDYSEGMKSNRFIGQCGLADHTIRRNDRLEEFGSTGQFGLVGTYTKPTDYGLNTLGKVGSVWNNNQLVDLFILTERKNTELQL